MKGLRARLWAWWRKPTKVELYKWVLAEFPYAPDAVKKNLDALAKAEMLYQQNAILLRRIEIEVALLERDIEEAKEYEVGVDWIKSTAKNILEGRRKGHYWNSRLLS